MPTTRKSRAGSMQFWPRKRARRQYARVRAWANKKEPALLGFAGYKVGMAHVMYTDNRKTSKTKGQDISCSVTILECPPLKITAVRFYKKGPNGMRAAKDIIVSADKDLARKIILPKKEDSKELDSINPEEYGGISILACTQPRLTGIGKKKPELFEIALGGDIKSKFEYAKSNISKEIKISDVFKEGDLVDIHAVTKGKGNQGPVKRFGIGLKSHRSEKKKRAPGNLGPWCGQGHIMYRIAHAGQMGYHTRTEYNKWIMKMGHEQKDIEAINPKGGFKRYGLVKNPFVFIKGSVGGPSKRMVRINAALRQNRKIPKEAPSVQKIMVRD